MLFANYRNVIAYRVIEENSDACLFARKGMQVMCAADNGESRLALSAPPQRTEPSQVNHELSPHEVSFSSDQSELRECNYVRKAPLIFFMIGVAFSLFPIANSVLSAVKNKDYSLWYEVGRAVLAGEPLYRDVVNGEPQYMYPPTAAVLFYAPLAFLHPVFFVTVLSLINAFSYAYAAYAATELIACKSQKSPFLYSIAPGLMIAPYVWDIVLLGQTNLFLLALTLGAFIAMRNRHPLMAGNLFGIAVSLKAFPMSAIAYFFVRRQWKAVAASVFSIFVLIWLLPGIVRGFDRNTAELRQWASLMIADQSGNTMAGRSSIGFTRRNQSLVSCSHRLLRHIDAGDNPNKPLYVNMADVSPKAAQWIGHGICLLLGLVLLLSCRFQFAPTPAHEGLEIALVCTLVPLCSPLAWTYFFCWLLPAWTAVGFWLNNTSLTPCTRRIVKVGACIAALLMISAVSEQIDPTLQAFGVTAFGSVSLFLTLAYIRFSLPNRSLA